ncbi:MAG: hypothetical protein DMG06_16345, partial [Acidobacteria bacterium]
MAVSSGSAEVGPINAWFRSRKVSRRRLRQDLSRVVAGFFGRTKSLVGNRRSNSLADETVVLFRALLFQCCIMRLGLVEGDDRIDAGSVKFQAQTEKQVE